MDAVFSMVTQSVGVVFGVTRPPMPDPVFAGIPDTFSKAMDLHSNAEALLCTLVAGIL